MGHNANGKCTARSGCHKHALKHIYGTRRVNTSCAEAVPVGIAPQCGRYDWLVLHQYWPVVRPVGSCGEAGREWKWMGEGKSGLAWRDCAGGGYHHWILNPSLELGSPIWVCSSLHRQNSWQRLEESHSRARRFPWGKGKNTLRSPGRQLLWLL